VVHPAVCLSHSCTVLKAVRRNEMPFGRDACVVPSIFVLDRGARKGKLRGWNSRFAVMLAIAKLLEALVIIINAILDAVVFINELLLLTCLERKVIDTS